MSRERTRGLTRGLSPLLLSRVYSLHLKWNCYIAFPNETWKRITVFLFSKISVSLILCSLFPPACRQTGFPVPFFSQVCPQLKWKRYIDFFNVWELMTEAIRASYLSPAPGELLHRVKATGCLTTPRTFTQREFDGIPKPCFPWNTERL